MLRINMLLKSGDAPQEFFDRHISRVRHVVSGVSEACSEETLHETPRSVNSGLDDAPLGERAEPGRELIPGDNSPSVQRSGSVLETPLTSEAPRIDHDFGRPAAGCPARIIGPACAR
jgi:hypothetical protein